LFFSKKTGHAVIFPPPDWLFTVLRIAHISVLGAILLRHKKHHKV